VVVFRVSKSDCMYAIKVYFLYRSDSDTSFYHSSTMSKHQMEIIAFQKCSTIIVEKLNIPSVVPHLLAKEMLTQRDTQIMLNQSIPDVDKTTHLICVLPRQGDGFFKKFLLCLCESKLETGHSDIIKSLTAALKEVKSNISGYKRSAFLGTLIRRYVNLIRVW